MNHSTLQSRFIIVAKYPFVLLFVYAAVSKLLDFDTFETQLGQSPLLSAFAHWVALLVPISELTIAIMLCIPCFRLMGLYGFYGMMVMFTTYIVIILNFTSFTPCSCGGVLEDLGWTEHFIFNVFFVFVSGLSIFLYTSHRRKSLITLVVITLSCVVAIIVLFLSSETQIKRNNAFIRRYMPHALENVGTYQLKSNSYYLAGMDSETIYLGNYNAPLFVTRVDTSLTNVEEFQMGIDSLHLPYRRVRLSVNPPYFYLGDGTIPILFKGKTKDWKASIYSYHDAYFTEFSVVDSSTIGILTKSGRTQSNALGLIEPSNDSLNVMVNHEVLTRPLGRTFESDGMYLWNTIHQQFIYVYYYRNQYIVAEKELTPNTTGKTIDTINKAILDVAHYTKTDTYKLGGKTILVNRLSATYGDHLYINSDRLGRYEDDEVMTWADIIDMYDFRDNTYAFSFYLYHQRDKRLNEFRIYKDLLVAIVDDQLWIYRLKPEYFNSGSNATYTAPYQD